MRLLPAVLLTGLVCCGLVACDGADDAPAATSAPTSEPGTSSPSAPTSSSPPSSGVPGGTDPGEVLLPPAPGTCEPVPESADGRYVVADAGVVTLRLEDGSVQLDVSSSEGWGTTAAHTPIQALVTFTRGGEELVLEAEREDGRLLIQVCGDGG